MTYRDATAEADHATARAEIERQDQRITAIRRELQRRGFELHLIDPGTGSGRYVVVRWGRARELRDLAELEKFAALAAPRAKP